MDAKGASLPPTRIEQLLDPCDFRAQLNPILIQQCYNKQHNQHCMSATAEDAWGMPRLGGAACDCAPPMADFFVPNTTARR
jgi:hypothetical protein